MKIRIIAVGKIKEAYLKMGIEEYLKRLKPYSQIEIIEVLFIILLLFTFT